MIGTNLSMGLVFISTGAAGYMATILFPDAILPAVFTFSLFGFIVMGSLVHFYHLFIGNVATLIVIMIPMVLELGMKSGVDPLYWVLITGASSLLGFILVIQTMPGVIVYSTGKLNALDFIKAGFPLTIVSIAVIALAARFWWPFLEKSFGM
jgi:solute carrier family 13 (sodium-dependent dicarboxylate transporter), member 2/3/5